MPQTKHNPLRKCTGGQEMKPKNTMMRILHTPEDTYVIDRTGKKNGRGAYLCLSMDCFLKAQKNRGLERSLKGRIPQEVLETLKKEIEAIDEG